MAEALPLARALDEAGDVGRHEGGVPGAHDAEVGHQRREGVVGDLGPGRAHAGDEGALAHGWHAHEGGVGHELHLELNPVVAGRLALLGEGRGAAHRRDEVDVAAAADAARRHDDALAGDGEVADLGRGLHGLGVELADHGAHGHAQHEVGAVAAVLAGPLAVGAALGPEVVLVAVVDERGELGVALEDHVAAVAAVPAVGPSLGDMGLPAEAHATGASVASAHVDAGNVGELRHGLFLLAKRKDPRRR